MDAERIVELKKKYSKIYEGSISFEDEQGEAHELTFVYRRPRVSDVERFQNLMQKSPLQAQIALLASIIVEPDAKVVIDELEGYPIPVGSFIDEVITPFFGSKAQVASKAL